MIRKRYIIVALGVISVLLGSMFVSNLILAQSGGEYDPWLDYNEDGIIDVNDLSPLGQAYSSSGDPTKNVNVTNWPEPEKSLFSETLALKTTKLLTTPRRYDLIGETAPYLPGSYTSDMWTYTPITTTPVVVYNRTFIYEDVPTRPYRILGKPTIAAPFNMTQTESIGLFVVSLTAYVGKASFVGDWTQLQDLGTIGLGRTGILSDHLIFFHSGGSGPMNATINAYERLAIRLVLKAYTAGGTGNLMMELLCNENNHGIIYVPITENS